MQDLTDALGLAATLIVTGDPDLWQIVALSLRVSLTATALACLIGIPVGALLAMARFRGRGALIVLINAAMGLPPVVVGLAVYMALSRSGPLGVFGLLYTPTAMIIAQTILIAPIVTALSRQALEDLHGEYAELFRSLCLTRGQAAGALVRDGRGALVTAALAGFGRAVAEVGAVILVGGNIDHLTRVMTTAIALETSKGNLALALALGAVLMVLALGVNALVQTVRPPQAGASLG